MYHNPDAMYHHSQCDMNRNCTPIGLTPICNCKELQAKDHNDLIRIFARQALAGQDVTNALKKLKHDAVSHPSHYTSHPSGVECIQITRHYNFNIGNAIKYLWRNGLKDEDAQIQDLEKAIWYIQDYIKTLKETNDK